MKLQAKLHLAKWFKTLPGGKVACGLCPRGCQLSHGQQGYCHSRMNVDGRMYLTSWQRCSGVHVDPIEKKPLYHFQPASRCFSVGTVGCNLGCLFCQNYHISRVGPDEHSMAAAPADVIVQSAMQAKCRSVALTYNEPIIFAEYGIEIAQMAKAAGLGVVAVSNGYICPKPREEYFKYIDAANIDLKAFTDSFYRNICDARLAPVLDTIAYLAAKDDFLLELTTLLIPGENDSEKEITQAADWIIENCGECTPWHLTGFFPAWKMMDKPPAQPATLKKAREIAISRGLKFVYTGNVYDPQGATTSCPHCNGVLIRRDGFTIVENRLVDYKCSDCGADLTDCFF